MQKILFGTFVLAAAVAAQASVTWNPTDGGDLDVADNWSGSAPSDKTYIVKKAQTAPLTWSQTGVFEFFGGEGTLRFNGAFSVTNVIESGCCLTNLGLNAESALHAEGGAKVTFQGGGKIYACKGTRYDGTYVTDNSALISDGVTFKSPSKLTLRSNSAYDPATGVITQPTIEVRNGGSVSATDLDLGAGNGRGEGRALVTGAGSELRLSNTLRFGTSTANSAPLTNRLTVTDHAYLWVGSLQVGVNHGGCLLEISEGATASINNLYIGAGETATSNNVARISGGAVVTNVYGTFVGGFEASGKTKYDKGGDLLTVEGEGTEFVAKESVAVCRGSTLRVAAGGHVDAIKGVAFADTNGKTEGVAALDLTGGRLDVRGSSTFAFPPYASLTGDGGALAVATTLSVTNGATFAVTNAAVAVTNVGGKANNTYLYGKMSFKGGTYDYNKLVLDGNNAEVSFEDTVVNGRRLQMAGSNTIVRLVNAQYTVAYDNDASAIFMMGDGSGNDAENNAYERHIYVSGSNTYVRALHPTYGIYVRGSNTTFHVDIPAEGFSTAHPVFEAPVFYRNYNAGLRIKITVDPELAARGGGTYTLFKGKNAVFENDTFEYDPNLVEIIGSGTEANAELKIRVKSKRGMVLLVR